MTCLEERLAAVFGTLTRGDEQPCSWTLSRGVPFNPGRSLAVDDSEEDEVAPQVICCKYSLCPAIEVWQRVWVQIMPQHAIDSPERDDGLYGSGPGEGRYPGGEEAPRACHTSAYRRQFEVEQEEDAYDQLADGGWCPGGLPQDAPPPGDTEVVEDNVYDRMCIQAGSRVTAAAAADADDAMAIDAVAISAVADTATAGGVLATAAMASACAAAGTLASSSDVTPFQPPLTLPLPTQALPVVGTTAEAANSETPGKNLVEQQGDAEVPESRGPEAGGAGGPEAGGPGLKGLDIEGMGRGGRVLSPPAQPLADPSAMPSLPDPPSPMRRESEHGGQEMTTVVSKQQQQQQQQQQERGGAESDRQAAHGCLAARPAKAIKRVHWQDDRPPSAEPAPKHGRDGSSSSSNSGRAAQPGLRSASILLPPAPGTACPAAGQLPRALLPAPHFTKGAAGGPAGAGGEERVGTRSKRGRRGQGPPMLAWQQPGYVPDHVRNPHKYKVYDLGETLVVGGGERLQGKQGVQDQQGQQGAGGCGLDGLAGRHRQQGVGPGSVVGEGSVQPAQLPAGQQGEAEGVGVEEGGAAQPPGLKAVKFQPRGAWTAYGSALMPIQQELP
ncbi:hypothetical protein QJQ45_016402 [Haematococcus lacustris]|nr:hypothetical protein QJQ45_016402 [Haematococcus lacustris]